MSTDSWTPDEDDLRALRVAREATARRHAVPESERHPFPRPEKFADPLGMDREGNLFAVVDDEGSADERDT